MIQTLTNQGCVVSKGISADREAIEQLVRSSRSWFARALVASKAVLPAVAVAGAVVLTLGSVLSHHSGGTVPSHIMIATTERVVVGRGDSLWRIAHQYGDPQVAMEDRIESLAHLNGLQPGSTLIAGQRLLVPVSNPVELASHQVSLASR